MDPRLIGNLEDRVRRLEILQGITPSGQAARAVYCNEEMLAAAVQHEKDTGTLYPEAEIRKAD